MKRIWDQSSDKLHLCHLEYVYDDDKYKNC